MCGKAADKHWMFDDSCWAIRNLAFEIKCHLKVFTPYMLTEGGVPWPQIGTPALKNKQNKQRNRY